MDGLTASRIAGGNTAYSRNKQDLYPTPPEVTYALLDFLALPCGTRIWEPACGNGDMVREMETWGYQVTGTDISMGQDFLTVSPVPCDWIITNPPFSLSEEFIRRCRYIGKPFALLLKSQFWHARKRLKLFQSTPPAWVLPLAWRPDFLFKARGKGAPLMDVLWCVWNPGKPSFGTHYQPLPRPDMGGST